MRARALTESWLSNIRQISWKKVVEETDKAVIGILTFEVVSLMSKVVRLWNCLNDKEFGRLKAEITGLEGVRKFVSDDDFYLMELVLKEIVDNLEYLARSTARIGKRCTDSLYHCFEQFLEDPTKSDFDCIGWEYRWKKMDRKVKEMERFVAVTTQLSQELEVLVELEQTLRRMHTNPEVNRVKVLEFQQKVMCQRQEVSRLREMSPWNRTYDYTARLLLRSIFTIVQKIKCVFGIKGMDLIRERSDVEHANPVLLPRCHSFAAVAQAPNLLSEENIPGFHSGPLWLLPLNPGLLSGRSGTNCRQQQPHCRSSALFKKHQPFKTSQFSHIGPFKGCMPGGSESPILNSCQPLRGGSMRISRASAKSTHKLENRTVQYSTGIKSSFLCSKSRFLNAPPSTLGDAALSVHYANVIILIEKLALSPVLIGRDVRDDLYNMLPTTIRIALRARLKAYAKLVPLSIYDAALAAEWNGTIMQILECLSPLAHNMIRWHSEQTVEKQQIFSGTQVLLVQTLQYANKEKTEAAITELLVGLNYVCRINGDLHRKDSAQPIATRAYHNFLYNRDDISVGAL